jgi:RNA polymerase sigma-B factor
MASIALEDPAPARASRNSVVNQLLADAQHEAGSRRRELLDQAVVHMLPVARSVAGRYRNRGVALEDLEQVACLALVGAASRYDPGKADDFLSYAVPTIRGEVKRYFRDHAWSIRPPRRIQEVQGQLAQSDAARSGSGNIDPQRAAHELGLDVEDVNDALRAQGCFTPNSLDAPQSDGETPFSELLVDDQFDEHAAVEARVILRTLTKELSPRERLILYLRFVEGRTQAEIGDEIGVTQMQVSRLLSRILQKMRARLEEPTAAHVA